jgi:hypothetical protein
MNGQVASHTARNRKVRKAKKTYSLSPESVEFLEKLRQRPHAPSVSFILAEILQAVRREQGKAALERAVADYYSSFSAQDAADEAEWGEFAQREFSKGEA